MELVNKNYVKMNKFDIFSLMNKFVENHDYEKLNFMQKMFSELSKYEREKNEYISDVYIGVDAEIFVDEYDFMLLTIKRDSVINAYFYSCFNGEENEDLKYFSIWKEFKACELGENLDYVLDNSISMNEYFDGENKKFIYNFKDECLDKGYVYSKNGEKKFIK